uniref:Uncharacterized protein n=1 Tax=Panagrolaimus sp. PS1159 TaxID=55785 RepID=A0AC35GFE1_9BILA
MTADNEIRRVFLYLARATFGTGLLIKVFVSWTSQPAIHQTGEDYIIAIISEALAGFAMSYLIDRIVAKYVLSCHRMMDYYGFENLVYSLKPNLARRINSIVAFFPLLCGIFLSILFVSELSKESKPLLTEICGALYDLFLFIISIKGASLYFIDRKGKKSNQVLTSCLSSRFF